MGGTLYYTAFGGQADFAILNAYGIDAMTLGNHEFEHGPASLSDYLAWADFPMLAANLDVSREPFLAGKIPAYTLKTFGHERVAVIGVTTPESASISSQGDTIVFNAVAASVAQTVGLFTGAGDQQDYRFIAYRIRSRSGPGGIGCRHRCDCYVSGLRFDIEESAAKGARVTHLEYRPTLGGGYEAFDADDT